MVNFRKQRVADGSCQREQDGGARSGIDLALHQSQVAIASHLEHIAQVAEAQHTRSRLFTTMHTASVPLAGTIMRDLHLPEESAIASAYIENATIATLIIYEGSSPSGRVIGIVPPNYAKRMALADHISSISIAANQPDPSSALVIVTLSTRSWSPTQSSLSPITPATTPVSPTGTATGSATVYPLPAGNILNLTYAMLSISAGGPLAAGDRIALYAGATPFLVMDHTTPSSVQVAFGVPLRVASPVTIVFTGAAGVSVNWTLSGFLT